MANKKSFEEKMLRLEELSEEMQSSELYLQKSVDLFTEGVELINELTKELEVAEEKIKILVEQNNKVTLKDYEE